MLAIQDYLESIKNKVQSKRSKSSKLKSQLLNIIKENIKNGEPNTYKNITAQVGHKHESYVRQLVSKHQEDFKVVKVNGVSIVLPQK